jgi:ABC-type transport system involved in multi-copper enzyme maturation permease subunit
MLAIIIERDPLKLDQLPAMVQGWIMAAGTFATLGLIIWLAFFVAHGLRRRQADRSISWTGRGIAVLIGGLVVMWLPVGLRILWNWLGWTDETAAPTFGKVAWYYPAQQHLALPPNILALEYGASCAIMAALLPVLINLRYVRFRRVWALARLSFKESIRRRALWGFSGILLIFLFANWFLPYKAEDQVRNYVRAVYWAMTPLLLVTAAVLASFSIPTDVKNQTIHTIVTKPVERFEIVLGRWIGYMMLMTMVLLVMSLLSLVYVARGVDEEAAEESLKAREPVYGNLVVVNPKNVGYVWDYRQYITGAVSDEEAIWTFPWLPTHLGNRKDTVRCEFTFDIFRTTKGEENKGVFCTFILENYKWQPQRIDDYARDRTQMLENPDPAIEERAQQEKWPAEKRMAVLANALAEKYGYYEINSKEVVDFHTLAVDLPAGLFKALNEWSSLKGQRPPPLRITVRCESPTQYLGVAKHDLYLLASDSGAGADPVGFALNFLKGAMGLWYRLCLVVALAVTCSTYLSGVISFLTTMFIFISGLFLDFIKTVAEGKAVGGGPIENAIRLGTGAHPVTPLDATPGLTIAKHTDLAFEWAIGRFINLIPDVDRFSLTNHVADGFNIGGTQLLMIGVLLAGYLLPWLILAYYLIKSREIASS